VKISCTLRQRPEITHAGIALEEVCHTLMLVIRTQSVDIVCHLVGYVFDLLSPISTVQMFFGSW
jgi:hypothetical protein